MGVTSTRNLLLQALPPGELEQLLPQFERVEVQKGDILWSVGDPLDFVYFPEAGLSSNVAVTGEGRRIEVGCFGYEGMVSTASVLNVDRAPHELLVQVGGPWLRIGAEAFRDALRISPALHDLLMRYTHTMIMTVSQTAMSNGAYSVEERLARWILMAHDRLEGDELALTHDFLSIMLATQRSTVTLAIQALEGYGAIQARRALIIIRDRGMLCDLAGNSYGPAEAEYERLIGPFRKTVAASHG
ncbi:Crp/Fnr family transcriptional regulator [Methylobacterium sp. R2-1]|uniref:Crp/Fnr family transcriptional regulator n=1 Tax=Methylobacterium sp. R2-1 TaxID=2587064 RepID=UPI0016086ECF|nr:Crp/Fnr family transcriptional regulator [Methylobacterium sp. R2-1]MBB2962242.1 CRP-like cAMP-binding protein [Methylobacterium sp. R2-1]